MADTESSLRGVSYNEYRGQFDDVPVIHVETDPDVICDGPKGPEFRLYVNDEIVYEGVPLPSEAELTPAERRGDQDPSRRRH